MQKHIKEIMNTKVEMIEGNMTIKDALKKMLQLDFSALPVMKDKHLMGMITKHDILKKVIANGKDPGMMKVEEAMNDKMPSCMDEDSLEHVAEMMMKSKVRGMPVLDKSKMIKGFVSLDDFVHKAHNEKLSFEILKSTTRSA